MSSYDEPPRCRRFEDEDDRPPHGSQSNGLATVSIILGIFSMCLGPLLGIPALICGILGIQKANRSGGAGHSTALTGLILGVAGCIVPMVILPALLLPAVQKVREAATR